MTTGILYFNCTAHPNSAWVTQQARNQSWELSQLERPVRLFIDDRDSKFVDDRDQVLSGEGAKVALTPYRRPRANAHCERVIKTIRHEALDWLIVFDERHLRRVLREYVAHYNRQRPHLISALGRRRPSKHPDLFAANVSSASSTNTSARLDPRSPEKSFDRCSNYR